jgi:hypothetical protein
MRNLAVEKSLYSTFLCYLRSFSGLKDVHFSFSNHLKREIKCMFNIPCPPYNWLTKGLLMLAKRSMEIDVYFSYCITEGLTLT